MSKEEYLADGQEPPVYFSNSPFYKENKNTLPNGAQVQKGGFYIMDDAGGVVFQLFTDEPKSLPTGRIHDSIPMLAVVDAVNEGANSVKALSFKAGVSMQIKANSYFDNGFVINNLIKLDNDPKIEGSKFEVELDSTSKFFIYNAHDLNGQIPVIHAQAIDCDSNEIETHTLVHGMVYVQFENDVYMGYLEKTNISIIDPNKNFCNK